MDPYRVFFFPSEVFLRSFSLGRVSENVSLHRTLASLPPRVYLKTNAPEGKCPLSLHRIQQYILSKKYSLQKIFIGCLQNSCRALVYLLSSETRPRQKSGGTMSFIPSEV